MDLDAYLERIGLACAPPPGLDGLLRITAAQCERIAFENVDPYLGKAVALDAASLGDKLLRRGRGGYCFELNGLLTEALATLGFRPRVQLARVMAGRDRPGPRTHQLVIVEIDGTEHLCDSGFGGPGLRHAMPLVAGRLEVQAGDAYRLRADATLGLVLEGREDGWQPLFCFMPGESFLPDDIEIANHYTSTADGSRFRQHLVLARTTPTGRHPLLDTTLRERRDGEVSELALRSGTDLARTLATTFGLRLDQLPIDALARKLGLPLGDHGDTP